MCKFYIIIQTLLITDHLVTLQQHFINIINKRGSLSPKPKKNATEFIGISQLSNKAENNKWLEAKSLLWELKDVTRRMQLGDQMWRITMMAFCRSFRVGGVFTDTCLLYWTFSGINLSPGLICSRIYIYLRSIFVYIVFIITY